MKTIIFLLIYLVLPTAAWANENLQNYRWRIFDGRGEYVLVHTDLDDFYDSTPFPRISCTYFSSGLVSIRLWLSLYDQEVRNSFAELLKSAEPPFIKLGRNLSLRADLSSIEFDHLNDWTASIVVENEDRKSIVVDGAVTLLVGDKKIELRQPDIPPELFQEFDEKCQKGLERLSSENSADLFGLSKRQPK